MAKMSQLIVETFDDVDDEEDEDIEGVDTKTIPLPHVRSEILKKIIEFGTYYKDEEAMTAIQTPLNSSRLEDMVQKWYVDFVNVDRKVLFDLVAAANFMDIKPLLDLTCLAVSILIKVGKLEEDHSFVLQRHYQLMEKSCHYHFSILQGKTPDELRVMFRVHVA